MGHDEHGMEMGASLRVRVEIEHDEDTEWPEWIWRGLVDNVEKIRERAHTPWRAWAEASAWASNALVEYGERRRAGEN